MLEELTTSKIKDKILGQFSSAKAIIIWGSSLRKGFIKESGDVDLIIVLDQEQIDVKDIQKKLNILISEFKNEIDLSPSVILLNSLKTNLCFNNSEINREAHGIEHYQIKHDSKVIYGDNDILDIIPEISFEDALSDVLLHIKDVFIKQIRDDLKNIKDIPLYLKEKANIFYVLFRTIYNIDKKALCLKLEALNYISKTYPEFLDLAGFLKKCYLNDSDVNDIKIKKEMIEKLLVLLEDKILKRI